MNKAANFKVSETNGSFLVTHIEGETLSVGFRFDPETYNIRFYVDGEGFHFMTKGECFAARSDIMNEQGEYRSGVMNRSEVNDGGGCSGFFDTVTEAIEFAKSVIINYIARNS